MNKALKLITAFIYTLIDIAAIAVAIFAFSLLDWVIVPDSYLSLLIVLVFYILFKINYNRIIQYEEDITKKSLEFDNSEMFKMPKRREF